MTNDEIGDLNDKINNPAAIALLRVRKIQKLIEKGNLSPEELQKNLKSIEDQLIRITDYTHSLAGR